MRHIVFRFVLALVWGVAAGICFVNGNIQMGAIYVVMFLVFGFTAIKGLKNNKEENRK